MDNGSLPAGIAHRQEKHTVATLRCGNLTAYIQGNLSHANAKAVFLTVHDMGCNHAEFCKFVEHPSMAEVKERSVIIHVDLPGQEDNAPDLAEEFQYPSMQELGESMAEVLDFFGVQYVVGLGEGAGANILARFGMAHPQRCLGLILIHCTSTVAGVMEYFKDKLINWKLSNVGMNPTAEQYLLFHKFGCHLEEQLESADNKEKVMAEFQKKLRTSINPRNLRRYVETFLNRTDLSERLEEELKIDVLLVTGSLASHLHTVHTMAAHLNRTKSTLLKIDNVGDVLNEAPDKLAHNLLLFVQGLGKLSSLSAAHGGSNRIRTISAGSDGPGGENDQRKPRGKSMEEYDVPNVRRHSAAKKE